jgi:hypothetical protein
MEINLYCGIVPCDARDTGTERIAHASHIIATRDAQRGGAYCLAEASSIQSNSCPIRDRDILV